MVLEIKWKNETITQKLKIGGTQTVVLNDAEVKRWGGSPLCEYAEQFAEENNREYAKDEIFHGRGYWVSILIAVDATLAEFKEWYKKKMGKRGRLFNTDYLEHERGE